MRLQDGQRSGAAVFDGSASRQTVERKGMGILYGAALGAAEACVVQASAKKLAEPPWEQRSARLWTVCAAAVGMACGCSLDDSSFYLPGALRLCTALSCLAGAAVCDAKGKRIPNLFPTAMLAVYIIASALDWLFLPDVRAASYVGGLISGILILALLTLFRGISRLLFHQAGIGMGDVKILTALGCLLGVNGAVGSLLAGQFAALATALILLVAKKATLHDTLPLAPFLWAGLTVCTLFRFI